LLSEAETRKALIDEVLRLAWWHLGDPTQVVEEYEVDLVEAGVVPPIAAEPGAGVHFGKHYVDYVLLSRGQVAALVEAKRTTKSARLGQEHARKDTFNCLRLRRGRPLLKSHPQRTSSTPSLSRLSTASSRAPCR